MDTVNAKVGAHDADALVNRRPCCDHMAVDWQIDEQPAPFRATAPIRRPFVHESAVTQKPEAPSAPALVRPITFGMLAASGLLAFYLGLITLAQGWAHATEQLATDRWYVLAIMTGFGTQVGLFVYLRRLHSQAMAGGVVASTGTSTAAMLACCAHHLSEVLAVIGLSGAALFIYDYKTDLLWLGITMNLAGISYLVYQIRKQRRAVCHTAPSIQGAR